jgi:hypothetical protein
MGPSKIRQCFGISIGESWVAFVCHNAKPGLLIGLHRASVFLVSHADEIVSYRGHGLLGDCDERRYHDPSERQVEVSCEVLALARCW